MKVLGAIREVNEFDMVVSLPNGLSGFVHITHINDKITERLKEELQADESNDTEVRKMSICNQLIFNVVMISLSKQIDHGQCNQLL